MIQGQAHELDDMDVLMVRRVGFLLGIAGRVGDLGAGESLAELLPRKLILDVIPDFIDLPGFYGHRDINPLLAFAGAGSKESGLAVRILGLRDFADAAFDLLRLLPNRFSPGVFGGPAAVLSQSIPVDERNFGMLNGNPAVADDVEHRHHLGKAAERRIVFKTAFHRRQGGGQRIVQPPVIGSAPVVGEQGGNRPQHLFGFGPDVVLADILVHTAIVRETDNGQDAGFGEPLDHDVVEHIGEHGMAAEPDPFQDNLRLGAGAQRFVLRVVHHPFHIALDRPVVPLVLVHAAQKTLRKGQVLRQRHLVGIPVPGRFIVQIVDIDLVAVVDEHTLDAVVATQRAHPPVVQPRPVQPRSPYGNGHNGRGAGAGHILQSAQAQLRHRQLRRPAIQIAVVVPIPPPVAPPVVVAVVAPVAARPQPGKWVPHSHCSCFWRRQTRLSWRRQTRRRSAERLSTAAHNRQRRQRRWCPRVFPRLQSRRRLRHR